MDYAKEANELHLRDAARAGKNIETQRKLIDAVMLAAFTLVRRVPAPIQSVHAAHQSPNKVCRGSLCWLVMRTQYDVVFRTPVPSWTPPVLWMKTAALRRLASARPHPLTAVNFQQPGACRTAR